MEETLLLMLGGETKKKIHDEEIGYPSIDSDISAMFR